jgi:hypothetical protein
MYETSIWADNPSGCPYIVHLGENGRVETRPYEISNSEPASAGLALHSPIALAWGGKN